MPRVAVLFALTLLAGCASPWGDVPIRPNADMRAVLTAQQDLGAKPIETLSVEAARQSPSIADAVRAVEVDRKVPTAPIPVASVRDISISGAAGPVAARVYDPGGDGRKPVILYFHGGGWVIGTIDAYDASARALASGTGAIVVSADYRQGPEHRFPAAHDDANAAYRWVLANAERLGGDRRKIAVAGESAGGNLAFDVSVYARDSRLPMPVHQLLIYPVAGTDLSLPSAIEDAHARPLSTAAVQWFLQRYISSPADLHDPRLDLVGAATVSGLPITTIILAEIDPLRSGGELLADKLTAASVPTQLKTYPLVTHEFFGTGAVVETAQAATGYASARLKETFDHPPALPIRSLASRRRIRR